MTCDMSRMPSVVRELKRPEGRAPSESMFIRVIRGKKMSDVFTKAKRSEVMSRIRSRGNKDTELALAKLFRVLEFPEIELIAVDAEVFDNVGDDPARHIARMPRESDQAIETKRIGV